MDRKTVLHAKREELARRQMAYQNAFATEGLTALGVKAVLEDLKMFCRANATCFHADPRIHAVLEGRREVMLRILDFTTLSLDELCVKYEGRLIPDA
jgi:hypothetical protein